MEYRPIGEGKMKLPEDSRRCVFNLTVDIDFLQRKFSFHSSKIPKKEKHNQTNNPI